MSFNQSKMKLSSRAEKYLKRLRRDKKWTSKLDETKSYLMAQGINPIDEFLRFQLLFSGYEFKIKNSPENTFSAYLISKKQIKENKPSEIENAGDRLIKICGDHKTAQFEFYITDKGEMCTLDNNNLPNITHDSFDKMIEEYALRNEIYKWIANPFYYKVLDIENLFDNMANSFKIIEECTDSYSTWWQSSGLIAVKGIWLDRPESYFHVYGKNKMDCDILIADLKNKEILK